MDLWLIFFSAAAWTITADALALRDDIALALKRANLCDKQARAFLQLESKGQYSEQMACIQHLSAWRMASWPPSFWKHFLLLRAERFGLRLIEDARIAELMQTLDQIQVRMLKMQAPDEAAQKESA